MNERRHAWWARAARFLTLRQQVALYRYVLCPLLLRSAASRGLRPPKAQIDADALPGDVVDALDAVGGLVAAERELARLDRLALPLHFALLSRPPSSWPRWVAVEGFEPVRAAMARRDRTLIVNPHVGPLFLPALHLLGSGHDVTSFVLSATRQLAQMRSVAREMLPQSDDYGRYDTIVVPHPLAMLKAMRAIRGGAVLIWQPDMSVEALTLGSTGSETSASIAPPETTLRALLEQVDAVFVVTARLGSLRHRPHARLWFFDVGSGLDGQDQASAIIAEARRLALENVDQWTMCQR